MSDSPVISIRPALEGDEPFLWDILYEAVYVPAGTAKPPRAILCEPPLAKYVAGWGRPGDIGFVACAGQQIAGAAWVRLMDPANPGWGYVDDETPELTIGLLPAFRGIGIGTRLLDHLLAAAADRYRAVSLSVDPNNPARRLYERFGFVPVGASGTSITMCRILRA